MREQGVELMLDRQRNRFDAHHCEVQSSAARKMTRSSQDCTTLFLLRQLKKAVVSRTSKPEVNGCGTSELILWFPSTGIAYLSRKWSEAVSIYANFIQIRPDRMSSEGAFEGFP